MRKQKEEKPNKLRNYLLLLFLFLFCIVLVLYLCKIYKVNDEEKKKTPVISGAISEIYYEDLEHYLMDNPTVVLYLCTANDDVCRSFERDFKKLLKKKEYNDQIIYLNLTDLEQDDFVNNFNNSYPYKEKLTVDYPAFVLFEDGKIKSILQGTLEKPLTIVKTKQFLDINKIGE